MGWWRARAILAALSKSMQNRRETDRFDTGGVSTQTCQRGNRYYFHPDWSANGRRSIYKKDFCKPFGDHLAIIWRSIAGHTSTWDWIWDVIAAGEDYGPIHIQNAAKLGQFKFSEEVLSDRLPFWVNLPSQSGSDGSHQEGESSQEVAPMRGKLNQRASTPNKSQQGLKRISSQSEGKSAILTL